MIRTPLRPLARIIKARQTGANPDAIEAENKRERHAQMADRARRRAEGRLLVLGVCFLLAYGVIGIRMGTIAASVPEEPRTADVGNPIISQRADILDRDGRILATNFETHSLYAQPPQMVDPRAAADGLAAIFPEMDAEELFADFTGGRKFLWLRRQISPEQMQAVFDIGDPGLLFGPREMRLYPNGRVAAHVLGGAGYGREGVNSAEVIGVAGVERAFDDYLRDPANDGAPLQLSLDLTVQAAVERVLEGGMSLLNARAASAVLMDVHTGEVISMASLPDFDPNSRPRPLLEGDPADSPIFNRAVQGVYELGSVFKIFTVAQAIENGLVSADTIIDTTTPMRWGPHRISDYRNYGPELSVTDVVVKSSNTGTARIALQIGADAQQDFLARLGLMEPTRIELAEARTGRPLVQKNWSDIVTMTTSYGHGLSSSPLHLAAAYATIVNGGTRVEPTILRRNSAQIGPRIISPETSAIAREMLRQVVVRGTATFAEVEGYAVGGKTGTADKPKPTGGYYEDRNLNTFAAVFPADQPRYVLITTLDSPVDTAGEEPRRTAGWTAVPVAGEIIRRVAPLLGLRPQIAQPALTGVSLTAN